jgi:hypothetical protein
MAISKQVEAGILALELCSEKALPFELWLSGHFLATEDP